MKFFDAHFHIIDPRFPLQENNGYLPPSFTATDYQAKCTELELNVCGGAIVSGSFQGFDQNYLIEALKNLGNRYVGVTNLPVDASDDDIMSLHRAGVRAARFNLFRGGSESIKHIEAIATRIYDLAKWHVELYVAAKELAELMPTLRRLPKISIDHLGLTKDGFDDLVKLARQGAFVKATGFMRTDFPILPALKQIYQANPNALVLGTDLPGTRASRIFSPEEDLKLIEDAFTDEALHHITYQNAMKLYNLVIQ